LLFKLAFHTYETLTNKIKISTRNSKKTESGTIDTTAELEISSNMSDESNITIGGPPGPMKEKKIDRLDESLDIKLNSYLKKW
jgi:hypothetical protein